jgi:hypothetical protein
MPITRLPSRLSAASFSDCLRRGHRLLNLVLLQVQAGELGGNVRGRRIQFHRLLVRRNRTGLVVVLSEAMTEQETARTLRPSSTKPPEGFEPPPLTLREQG